jgi:hypothetical protein
MSKSIIDIKYADKALGEEKIKEIVEKEWKVAELPSEEELKAEVKKSPMSRNNPNSRKNLTQYRKDIPVETKEKIVSKLTFRSKRKEKDLKEFFGDIITQDMLNIFQPMRAALQDSDEEDVFFGTIKFFIKDFPKGELSASDLDDIANLALNRVLELRLLVEAKKNPKRVVDVSSSIEKFRKNSEKIKMGLASRRMDRVDTKNKTSFSIVDLAVAFDESRKKELEDRVKEMDEEELKFLKSKDDDIKKLDKE